MQEVADAVRKSAGEGRLTAIGRVIDVKGFSTLPVDELVVVDDSGDLTGDLLGRPGAAAIRSAAGEMFSAPAAELRTVSISIHGPEVAEIGLSCGGQAKVLMQPTSAIPSQLWDLLAGRAPVALITRMSGPSAGPGAVVVDREGNSWGSLGGPGSQDPVTSSLLSEALELLGGSRTMARRVEEESGVVLIEAWVPTPRLVIVGGGEMVGAIEAQGALLGWDARATDAVTDVDGLLDWAGATAALIVLSHDPAIDAPALRVGLERRVAYVGAMGSRSTQSRRLGRLVAEGVDQEALDRIHRPIGLDLGGRRSSEVALAIAAEILACHCGRDGRPLSRVAGPIHTRA